MLSLLPIMISLSKLGICLKSLKKSFVISLTLKLLFSYVSKTAKNKCLYYFSKFRRVYNTKINRVSSPLLSPSLIFSLVVSLNLMKIIINNFHDFMNKVIKLYLNYTVIYITYLNNMHSQY